MEVSIWAVSIFLATWRRSHEGKEGPLISASFNALIVVKCLAQCVSKTEKYVSACWSQHGLHMACAMVWRRLLAARAEPILALLPGGSVSC